VLNHTNPERRSTYIAMAFTFTVVQALNVEVLTSLLEEFPEVARGAGAPPLSCAPVGALPRVWGGLSLERTCGAMLRLGLLFVVVPGGPARGV
jgi:hypothetical protein